MGAMLYWSSKPDYRLLYAGLSMKDAAAIREKLQDDKIPVELKDSGRSIYVPAGDVYRCRLILAAGGLPKESTTGFEVFEQPKFGLTDFAQQVNYQRALQGELERTIASMKGIASARVMLVLPKEKLFTVKDEQKASASILLTLNGGTVLSAAQVQSIVQLVGSSVPGLSPSSITVTDQDGRMLSRRIEAPEESYEQANEQLVAQEKTESLLTKKAQDILDKALGPDRSIVRVNVAMDFSKIDKRSEKYDSENRVVRTETIESENTSAPGGAAGGNVAGVVANVPVSSPGAASVDQGGMSKSKKENVRTEYAIPSDVEQISMRGAKIQHLSVSVCVAKGEKPRSPEDLKKIEQIVKTAVGFQDAAPRKDAIEIAEMEFPTAPVPAAPPWWKTIPISLDMVGRVLLGIVILGVIAWISKRVLASSEVRGEEVGVPLQTLAGGEAGTRQQMMEALGPGMSERNLGEIASIARQNPKSVAAWINSVSGSGTSS
jgi:flagellar M-ring protein FliF